MMSPDELGRIAYAAYGGTTDHKNYRGEPMPPWEELPSIIQRAWMAAANAVAMAALVATTTSPQRLVSATHVTACRYCGFLWPPGLAESAGRCPGCQQLYDA